VIARLGYFDDFDMDDREYVIEAIKNLPGFRGCYHLADIESGRALSVSFWDDEQSAAAGQQAVGEAKRAGGHGGPGPDRVETLTVVRSH
jgi:heme-degrading monooxygenase HmoA